MWTKGLCRLGRRHHHSGKLYFYVVDVIGQNVIIFLGSNMPLQSYSDVHRQPDMDPKPSQNTRHVSILTRNSLYYKLGMFSKHKLHQWRETLWSKTHPNILLSSHYSIVQALRLKHHYFLLRELSSLMNGFSIATWPEISGSWTFLLIDLVLTVFLSMTLISTANISVVICFTSRQNSPYWLTVTITQLTVSFPRNDLACDFYFWIFDKVQLKAINTSTI